MKDKQKILGLVKIDEDDRKKIVSLLTILIYFGLFAIVGAITTGRIIRDLYPSLLIRLFVLFLLTVGLIFTIYILVSMFYPRYNKVEIKK